MEKTVPPYHLTGRRGGNKSPKPRNLAWRDPNPKKLNLVEKLIKNDGSPLPPTSGDYHRRREGGGPNDDVTARLRRALAAFPTMTISVCILGSIATA